MSHALRIARGQFGRVALLDMDRPLVRHAHPHCHVLLKVEGADTFFSVRNQTFPLTNDSAILINAWEPHAYVHDLQRPKTVILALYIEPQWLAHFRKNWGASHAPDFFEATVGSITADIQKLVRELAEVMVYAPENFALHEHTLGQLMIAVIERFSAWRSLPRSISAIAAEGAVDFRIRKAVKMMTAAPGTISDMSLLATEVGLSRAHFFGNSNMSCASARASFLMSRGSSARSAQCQMAKILLPLLAKGLAFRFPRISLASFMIMRDRRLVRFVRLPALPLANLRHLGKSRYSPVSCAALGPW